MKRLLEWQIATVKDVRPETSHAKTLTLALPDWMAHRPGQHYDVRLTAPDGYQTERSYSIASEPERAGEIDLTVERLPDGEVSSYLDDVLVPGDRLEVRGPIGGYFVWEASLGGPLLLVAGGSGIVPLMAMIRHCAAARASVPVRLLYSSRSPAEAIYHDELERRATGGSVGGVVHLHPQPARRLARLCEAHRSSDARRGQQTARPRPAGLRLWPNAAGRRRGQPAGRLGHSPGAHPHGALRTHRPYGVRGGS